MMVLAWPPEATFAQDSYMVRARNGQMNTARASLEAAGATVSRTIDQINVLVVDTDDANFASQISGLAGVEYFTSNPTVQWQQPEQTVLLEESAANNPPNSGDDDFFFDLQWGHDAVDAPEAWNAGNRGNGALVAVLDSGIDCGHPDLTPNLVHAKSASFVPGEPYCVTPGFYFNHGTHVAGTVAAADNAFGTIGVAPQAKIMAVKVLSEFTGSGAFDWVVAGIVHAADQGADIINMSLGALFVKAGQQDAAQKEVKALMDAATTYANSKGTLVIASAGNDGVDLRSGFRALPAESDFVLAISASAPVGWGADPYTDLDLPTSYSNYGQNKIAFAGPGGDADLSIPGTCTVGGLARPCWVFDLVFSTIAGGWGWASGTSMAAPHAAGVAAIIKGQYPWLSPVQLRDKMKNLADKQTGNNRDAFYGWGRVDAINGATGASEEGRSDALVLAGETPSEYKLGQNYPNPFNPSTAIVFDLPEQVHARLTVFDLLGKEVEVLVNGTLGAGQHEIQFDAATLPSGAYFYRIEAGDFVQMRQMLLLK